MPSSSSDSSSGSDSEADKKQERKSPSPSRKEKSDKKKDVDRKDDRKDDRRDDRDRNRSTARRRDPQQEARDRGKTKTEPNPVMTRAGGAYIPPARLRMMQQEIKDKSSVEYQRMAWAALKKSLNGFINKINVSNIQELIPELFQENLVRGRGVFAQACMRAQAVSPTFTHVYAALVSVINTKFPQVGELLLRRLILQFRRAFRRNDKTVCLNTAKFIAHLVNQQVAHEVLSLELLTLMLETPTDDSVEVAIAFLKECGQYLGEVSPRGIHAIFERLRTILHEGALDKRVQYMIEVMFAIRKDGFKDFPMKVEGLDLVEEADQNTHLLSLGEDNLTTEDVLNIFKFDPDYQQNEEKYKEIRAEILGESSDDESGDESSSSEEEEEEEAPGEVQGNNEIQDMTGTALVALRKTIYLTIMSSLDFEECAHKLLKMTLKDGQESELCNMIIDCCSQERSYLKFYGLLAQRFCQIKQEYQASFADCFAEQYESCHRLETNKLRHVAKLFAHILYTDALQWNVLQVIRLNENDTTSSSRIFIKELFLELSQFMGVAKLSERLQDPYLSPHFEGVFPVSNPKDTRFSINFFTSIGLGILTEAMREHLKNAPKMIMAQRQAGLQSDNDSSSSSSSSGSSSDSDSSSSSSSSSGSSSSSSGSSSGSSVASDAKKKRISARVRDQRRGQRTDSRRGSRSPSPQAKRRGRRGSPGGDKKEGLGDSRERSRRSPRRRTPRRSPRHSSPRRSRSSVSPRRDRRRSPRRSPRRERRRSPDRSQRRQRSPQDTRSRARSPSPDDPKKRRRN